MTPLMLLAVLLACTGPDGGSDDTGAAWSYPLDDVLTFHDLKAVGTHNSFHLRTDGIDTVEWSYDMAPLDVQLGEQGVRQLELDVNWNADLGLFEVYHVAILDQNTTCWLFTDCLATMKAWSDANPAHHPLFTLLEPKLPAGEDVGPALDELDAEVRSVWGERLITPDDIQGDHASVSEAVATDGWPTLGELRGRALFVLHDHGEWRDVYTDGLTTTAGRALFPDGDGDLALSVGAVDTINDPIEGAEHIAEVVAAGHLVRTRADNSPEAVRAGETAGRDAALASAAHFVSTDFPTPDEESGYSVVIPGGTPSACNAATAPPECTSLAIEDPAFVGP